MDIWGYSTGIVHLHMDTKTCMDMIAKLSTRINRSVKEGQNKDTNWRGARADNHHVINVIFFRIMN